MFSNPNFYYVTIAIQGVCIYHCIKKGNQNKWVWIIIILPIIGSLIYFFSEILTKRQWEQLSSNAGAVINPSGSIRKLEEQLAFSNTFQNKIELADAYLYHGYIEKAILLYEESRQGLFEENEHVLSQLIIAYGIQKNDDAILLLAPKIANLPSFRQSRAHLYFAIALGNSGETELAEKEFKKMNGAFSAFEPRYFYALFLFKKNRIGEAEDILKTMMREYPHLSPIEKKSNLYCYRQVKEELKRIAIA